MIFSRLSSGMRQQSHIFSRLHLPPFTHTYMEMGSSQVRITHIPRTLIHLHMFLQREREYMRAMDISFLRAPVVHWWDSVDERPCLEHTVTGSHLQCCNGVENTILEE